MKRDTTPFIAPMIMLLLYWASRLWQLMSLPLFLDEGIYIRRGWHVVEGDWAFEIFDGNVLQPRLLALLLPFTARSVETMQFAARWLSVAVGALTLLLLFVIARKAFSARVVWLAAGLYLAHPFVFFYDRMALADGLLMMWYVVAIGLSWRMVNGERPGRSALALGVVIGLASLTKLSGVVFVALPVLAALAADDWRKAIRRWPYGCIALAVAATIYVPIFIAGAGQYQIGAKSVAELEGGEQFGLVAANFGKLLEWMSVYTPGLMGALTVAALVASARLGRRAILWAGAALVPMAFFVVVSRIWYPRYVLSGLAPLILLMAWLLDQLLVAFRARAPRWASVVVAACAITLVAPSAHFIFLMATEPPAAPWPAIERWQYIEDWPAGYGMAEAAAFLKSLAAQSANGIHLARTNKNSPTLEIIDLYFRDDPKVTLHAIDLKEPPPGALTALKSEKPTYVIADPPREGFNISDQYPLKPKRAEFPKPSASSAFQIYQW